jgi:hypothetical protein
MPPPRRTLPSLLLLLCRLFSSLALGLMVPSLPLSSPRRGAWGPSLPSPRIILAASRTNHPTTTTTTTTMTTARTPPHFAQDGRSGDERCPRDDAAGARSPSPLFANGRPPATPSAPAVLFRTALSTPTFLLLGGMALFTNRLQI